MFFIIPIIQVTKIMGHSHSLSYATYNLIVSYFSLKLLYLYYLLNYSC